MHTHTCSACGLHSARCPGSKCTINSCLVVWVLEDHVPGIDCPHAEGQTRFDCPAAHWRILHVQARSSCGGACMATSWSHAPSVCDLQFANNSPALRRGRFVHLGPATRSNLKSRVESQVTVASNLRKRRAMPKATTAQTVARRRRTLLHRKHRIQASLHSPRSKRT